MYIAVCDDSAQELNRIRDVLQGYAAAHDPPIRYQFFSDAERMLETARAEHFTHYFLDIMMPSMDGISAAQEIRSFDTEAKLVFLTSFKEFAYQSYRVKATDYLLKPVHPQTLAGLLSQLQAEEKRTEECICIQNGRSVYRIPYAKLSYLEVNQKQLYFHTTDGHIRQVPGTMAQFETELLARPEFIKIHRSYIVNLYQVSIFSPDGCILFSGKNLPISRLLYNQVRRDYMAHLFGNTEV